jgi:hypothetical protein
MKLIRSLGLPLAGSIAVSAGAVSVFINIPSGNSKQPVQVAQPANNATTSGKNSPVVQDVTGSSINVKGDENHQNTTTVNGRQINTNSYTETDNRRQPTINCNGGNYNNKSVCGSVETGASTFGR